MIFVSAFSFSSSLRLIHASYPPISSILFVFIGKRTTHIEEDLFFKPSRLASGLLRFQWVVFVIRLLLLFAEDVVLLQPNEEIRFYLCELCAQGSLSACFHPMSNSSVTPSPLIGQYQNPKSCKVHQPTTYLLLSTINLSKNRSILIGGKTNLQPGITNNQRWSNAYRVNIGPR